MSMRSWSKVGFGYCLLTGDNFSKVITFVADNLYRIRSNISEDIGVELIGCIE